MTWTKWWPSCARQASRSRTRNRIPGSDVSLVCTTRRGIPSSCGNPHKFKDARSGLSAGARAARFFRAAIGVRVKPLLVEQQHARSEGEQHDGESAGNPKTADEWRRALVTPADDHVTGHRDQQL